MSNQIDDSDPVSEALSDLARKSVRTIETAVYLDIFWQRFISSRKNEEAAPGPPDPERVRSDRHLGAGHPELLEKNPVVIGEDRQIERSISHRDRLLPASNVASYPIDPEEPSMLTADSQLGSGPQWDAKAKNDFEVLTSSNGVVVEGLGPNAGKGEGMILGEVGPDGNVPVAFLAENTGAVSSNNVLIDLVPYDELTVVENVNLPPVMPERSSQVWSHLNDVHPDANAAHGAEYTEWWQSRGMEQMWRGESEYADADAKSGVDEVGENSHSRGNLMDHKADRAQRAPRPDPSEGAFGAPNAAKMKAAGPPAQLKAGSSNAPSVAKIVSQKRQ